MWGWKWCDGGVWGVWNLRDLLIKNPQVVRPWKIIKLHFPNFIKIFTSKIIISHINSSLIFHQNYANLKFIFLPLNTRKNTNALTQNLILGQLIVFNFSRWKCKSFDLLKKNQTNKIINKKSTYGVGHAHKKDML